MIRSRCERCRNVVKDADDRAGRRATCPACGHPYTVTTPKTGPRVNVKLAAGTAAAVAVFALVSFLIVRSGSSTPPALQKQQAAKQRREKVREERIEEREKDRGAAELEEQKIRDDAMRSRAEREEALRRQQREEEEALRRAIEEGRAPDPPEAPR